jgi:hypothetical protein
MHLTMPSTVLGQARRRTRENPRTHVATPRKPPPRRTGPAAHRLPDAGPDRHGGFCRTGPQGTGGYRGICPPAEGTAETVRPGRQSGARPRGMPGAVITHRSGSHGRKKDSPCGHGSMGISNVHVQQQDAEGAGSRTWTGSPDNPSAAKAICAMARAIGGHRQRPLRRIVNRRSAGRATAVGANRRSKLNAGS